MSRSGNEGGQVRHLEVQALDYESSNLRVEDLGHGIRRLTLTRPERRNAFDPEVIRELTERLDALSAEEPASLRGLVLAGEGKVFSAGADLGYMKRLAAAGIQESLDDARRLAALFHRLASFPAPVVARVQGAAIGGGLGLTVCSDIVVASAAAIFQTSEVRLGIVPGVISPYIVRKVGVGNAASFMLTGARLRGAAARDLGLVQALAERGLAEEDGEERALDATLDSVIHDLLFSGPEALRRTKRLLLAVSPLPESAVVDESVSAIAEARCSDEGRAGLKSFFDKSTPRWVPVDPGPAS